MTVNAAGIGKDAGQRTTIAKVRLFALMTSANRVRPSGIIAHRTKVSSFVVLLIVRKDPMGLHITKEVYACQYEFVFVSRNINDLLLDLYDTYKIDVTILLSILNCLFEIYNYPRTVQVGTSDTAFETLNSPSCE